MNAKRRIYHTECMMSHVPDYQIMVPEFWRCDVCGSVYVQYRRKETASGGTRTTAGKAAAGQTPLAADDGCRSATKSEHADAAAEMVTDTGRFASAGLAGTCCSHPLTKLLPCREEEKIKEHLLQYCIFGGPEHNTIRVEVADGGHPMTEEHRIEWMFLYSYQGGTDEISAPWQKSKSSGHVFFGGRGRLRLLRQRNLPDGLGTLPLPVQKRACGLRLLQQRRAV